VDPRAAADRPEHQSDLAQSLLLFLSLPAVATTVTCNKRKMHKQLILILFSHFLDLVLSPLQIHLISVLSLPPVLDLAVVVRGC
jgi:hypothetical protein